jgi:anthranilate synthase component 1
VRAECRGEDVILHALSRNGGSLLELVAAALSGSVVDASADRLHLSFPHSRSLDLEARLRAASPLQAIRSLLRSGAADSGEPFAALGLGVFAFDYAALGEDLPDNPEDPLGFPDYVFWIAESLVLFEAGSPPRVVCTAFGSADPAQAERNYYDAVQRLGEAVSACEGVEALPPPPRPTPVDVEIEVDLDDSDYSAVVRRLKEEIARGEIYQIVPSRTFKTRCSNPLRAYAALRAIETNSYRFFVRAADFVLFGASPETSVRLFGGEGADKVEVRPIAGTRQRGRTEDEDDRLEAEMRLDTKEIAEHMMLVDLARNDVARISVPGTRRVERLLTVERYARVMHLVSSVTGKLASGFDALDALAACLNVGTLTGAPKIRATELLRQVERFKRGPYGGAIGWINAAGSMETSVVIRSALIRDGAAYVRAGAGVVHDSDPQSEADETRRKASALLSILAAVNAEEGE